jgi:hypothetical protein
MSFDQARRLKVRCSMFEVQGLDFGLWPFGQNVLLGYILSGMVTNAFAIVGLSVYWSKAGLSGELSAVALIVSLLTLMWLLTRARLVMKL